ncbi:MAG: N-methylhydantoinase [Gammaproteobacteria bacterium]|nr:N-methylhydantoinase [Gammaproteobacteria bacterium]
MTASATDPVDAIGLEVLRTRLAAMAEEGALTIERTACSPVIAESRDCSCTLLDADAQLMIGGGAVAHHFGVCDHAVQCTIAIHGDSLAQGDVFIANDPHNGGGLHYQDVVVQRPVFVEGRIVGWAVNSGHMMDMGGMAFGSWAPAATECYQEALRLPPVRLFRAGVEQRDVWAILRNNIRVSHLVEMDIRSLVAGSQVAHDKMVTLATAMGAQRFIDAVRALRERTEREMRRRISLLEDGEYSMTTWTEWGDELYKVPCRLTIDGDRMLFDFDGAAPQTNHFFNSKAHIIRAIVVSDITDVLAHDLPLSAGLFAPISLNCPDGTVVNSRPPAPTASAHFDVALNASMAAQQCVMMAVAASGDDAPGRHLLSGPVAPSSMGLHTWSYQTQAGTPDGWLMLDGAMAGGSAGHDRDGYDLFSFMVARKAIIEAVDVELFESRFPALVLEKRPRPGVAGAGRYRAGAGSQMAYKPYGAAQLTGVMLGMREWLPLPGFAGGMPGANTEFAIRRADGRRDIVSGHASGVVLNADDVFEFRLGSGGGFGDPLERVAAEVARDVRQGRLTVLEASSVYGVVVDSSGTPDAAATDRCRADLSRARLLNAAPAVKPLVQSVHASRTAPGSGMTLYPGVEQKGAIAYAVSSGAALALAPDHWTDGCPVLDELRGQRLLVRSYLDPLTGRILFVDALPRGEKRTIDTRPNRWVRAAKTAFAAAGAN